MPQALSRRNFLALTTTVLAAAPLSAAAEDDDDDVPALLDHILLGCSDLDKGMDFIEQNLGVRPAVGGVHPGRGTRNALLSLGERRYLEVIAPDPAQHELKHYTNLYELRDPRLIGWAVHPPDIEAVARQLRENKVEFSGPDPGSRQRPDGKTLNWKTINLANDYHGLLPFFIEWSSDTVHPSKDAPKKCTLGLFDVRSDQPDDLAAAFKRIGLDIPVQRSDRARLHAVLTGPKGDFGLSS